MTSTTASSPIIDVHVILRVGEKILLSQRRGPYGQGMWHAPSGKLDPGETITAAAVRETSEETGVDVAAEQLCLVHTVHHHQGAGAPDRIGFFFEARTWHGEPTNREPDKCLQLAWFTIHDLPEQLIPYPAAGLHAYLVGRTGITTHGWDSSAPRTLDVDAAGITARIRCAKRLRATQLGNGALRARR